MIAHPPGSPKSSRPIVSQLNVTGPSVFSDGQRLRDDSSYTVCKHCKKSVIKVTALLHITSCPEARPGEDKEGETLQAVKLAAAAITAPKAGEGGEGGGFPVHVPHLLYNRTFTCPVPEAKLPEVPGAETDTDGKKKCIVLTHTATCDGTPELANPWPNRSHQCREAMRCFIPKWDAVRSRDHLQVALR